MKLKGKCLEDFEIFYITELRKKEDIGNRYFDHTLLDFFWRSGDTMINAFIIEFFDSVGIHIGSDFFTGNYIYNINHYVEKQNRWLKREFKPLKIRKEAANAAIEKANEIYNEKNK